MENENAVTYDLVNKEVIRPLLKPSAAWAAIFAIDLVVLAFGIYCWSYQLEWGMGVAGYTPPVFWGVYITTFVFWVGIGHAGTLISAVLYLFRARFRTGVYRASEAMTIFAVLSAGLFPNIHVGRLWYVYYLFPYPNQRLLWPNFKSPLLWDVFAISTYLTISSVFFFVGLIPDVAAVRDSIRNPLLKKIYNMICLGWRGSDNQWRHYMAAYGFFAALCTPLVVSVHSVVSWDFAMAQTAGWHSTIFPPYFVAGAIFSGCAMVITLLVPITKIFKWENYLNVWHFESMAKMCILTGFLLTYSYGVEHFIGWYSDNPYEWGIFVDRATGQYDWIFFMMVACNCVIPLVWWWRKARTNLWSLWIVSIFINIGMWFERYNIIASALSHQFDPAAWVHYVPSWVEMGIMIGSFAWFGMWFLLFIKLMPSIAIAEIKEMIRPPLSTDTEEAA